MFTRRFPNGFKSWQKTHYHVVEYITGYMNSSYTDGILTPLYEQKGHEGLYEIATEWARLYEFNHKSEKVEPERKRNQVRNFCENQNLPW